MGERLFKLDGLPSPVPLSELPRVFRACMNCRRGLAVLVRSDSALGVSCGHCGTRWRVLRSGRIIRQATEHPGTCCFVAGFTQAATGDERTRVEVEEVEAESPVTLDSVLDLAAAWAAR